MPIRLPLGLVVAALVFGSLTGCDAQRRASWQATRNAQPIQSDSTPPPGDVASQPPTPDTMGSATRIAGPSITVLPPSPPPFVTEMPGAPIPIPASQLAGEEVQRLLDDLDRENQLADPLADFP